jgi:hypothetical protein
MRIRNELGIVLAAWMFVGIMRLLFRTLTFSYREAVAGTNPFNVQTTERYLYCVWHDSAVMPAFAGQHPSTSALTSRHADGSFVARVHEPAEPGGIQDARARCRSGSRGDYARWPARPGSANERGHCLFGFAHWTGNRAHRLPRDKLLEVRRQLDHAGRAAPLCARHTGGRPARPSPAGSAPE